MTNMAGSMNNTIGIVSLAPSLCALFFELDEGVTPKFVCDRAQGLAQRRAVLQALTEHGAEAAQPIRRRPQFLERLAAIRRDQEILEKTIQDLEPSQDWTCSFRPRPAPIRSPGPCRLRCTQPAGR